MISRDNGEALYAPMSGTVVSMTIIHSWDDS